MGYIVELNTLLGLPQDFDIESLELGEVYTVTKPRERAFPLHIAMLVVDKKWNFYGYCVVNSAIVKDQTTTLEFEMLSLFSQEESELYRFKFIEAAKQTGEVH